MLSWINLLILPLVIFSSVYATVLSSNLLARCEGRNKVIPLKEQKKQQQGVLASDSRVVCHTPFKPQIPLIPEIKIRKQRQVDLRGACLVYINQGYIETLYQKRKN